MNNKSRIAGILSIISGAFSVFGVFIIYIYALLLYFIKDMPSVRLAPQSPSELFVIIIIILCMVGFCWALFGALAIVGGILALKRKYWAIALAGSLAAAITFLPGGIAAIAFIAMAKHEFTKPEQVPISTQQAVEVESVVEQPKHNKAKIAGILTIIAGSWGMLGLGWAYLSTLYANFITRTSSSYSNGSSEFMQFFPVIYYSWGAFITILGILAIIGGIFALKRNHWGLALAGAIAGTITFYPCGIPAIILLAIAQKEFEDHTK
jgi:hypothetical protein